jgi:DNA-binding protein
MFVIPLGVSLSRALAVMIALNRLSATIRQGQGLWMVNLHKELGKALHALDYGGEQRMSETAMPSSEAQRPAKPREPIPPDTIFIGKKPLMAYVTAMMMHFQTGAKELSVMARGQAISRAVDVVEVVSRRFFAGKLNIKNISIGTEVVGEGDDIRNVSTIDIRVEKLA